MRPINPIRTLREELYPHQIENRVALNALLDGSQQHSRITLRYETPAPRYFIDMAALRFLGARLLDSAAIGLLVSVAIYVWRAL
jgi:hypothetical protein